jgi:hypothetical protein
MNQITVVTGCSSNPDVGYDAARHRLINPSLVGDFVTIQPLH